MFLKVIIIILLIIVLHQHDFDFWSGIRSSFLKLRQLQREIDILFATGKGENATIA